MTFQIKHKLTSAKSDGVDPTLVQPSNWNDTHAITAAAHTVLGNNTGSAGNVDEIAVSGNGSVAMTTGPAFTDPTANTQTGGNNSTKLATTAFIAAALAALYNGSTTQITIQSGGSPSGGKDGDICLIY